MIVFKIKRVQFVLKIANRRKYIWKIKRSSISSKPSAAASSFGQTLKGDEKKKAAAPAKPKVAAKEQVLRL
ncbi:hypothetical protein ACFX1Q_045409 [Malus domestica]